MLTMRFKAKHVTRVGPYFRRYSASVSNRTGGKAGWTSQGFALGRLTVNTTLGTWTYDTPGPGSASGRLPAWIVAALPRWLTRTPGEDV